MPHNLWVFLQSVRSVSALLLLSAVELGLLQLSADTEESACWCTVNLKLLTNVPGKALVFCNCILQGKM